MERLIAALREIFARKCDLLSMFVLFFPCADDGFLRLHINFKANLQISSTMLTLILLGTGKVSR